MRILKPSVVIGSLVVCAIMTSWFAIYACSWETKTAMLSCGYCGNVRIVRLRTSLWESPSVSEYTSSQFPIPAGHVHRWWQYDGNLSNPLGNSGWSRTKYEDGQFVWSEPMKADVVENRRLIKEDWLHID